MKRLFMAAALGMASTLTLSAGELEAVTLSDGTVLYGRVIETRAESIHLVSTRVNRIIPFEQMSPESRQTFQSPGRQGGGALEDSRLKLVDARWATAESGFTMLRPRIALAPVYTGYGYGAYYGAYYGWPAAYYPRSRCRHASTLTVAIDL